MLFQFIMVKSFLCVDFVHIRVSKKWLQAAFSSFYWFCLSLTLPGGKTSKVRKPKGFHPF